MASVFAFKVFFVYLSSRIYYAYRDGLKAEKIG